MKHMRTAFDQINTYLPHKNIEQIKEYSDIFYEYGYKL